MDMYIYGSGGHARTISNSLNTSKSYIFVVEDTSAISAAESQLMIREADLSNVSHKFIVGIGDNLLRYKVFNRIFNTNTALSLFDATAKVNRSAQVGVGSFCAAGSIIQNNVVIGENCIINTGAIVEHDCIVGAHSHIAPGSTLCGYVSIGEKTLIGAGSVVLPGIQIGSNCIVGAGCVVTKNIEHGSTVRNVH